MRRKDREVADASSISAILDKCKTCHLAMVDNGQPYVIPLNYAYSLWGKELTLFFHSAKAGRKIRILHENAAVCFVMSNEGEPVFAAETPCDSGYYYSSVHGFGYVQFVEDIDEKRAALSLLMKHQAGLEVNFTPEQAASVCVFKVVSTEYIGKEKAPQSRRDNLT